MSLSYRKRGSVPRTHTKRKATAINPRGPVIDVIPPKKITANNIDIKRILVYSASIIIANPPALYSVLNPETNSDSLSAKSKGVRLVSAKQETNQTIPTNGIIKINQHPS